MFVIKYVIITLIEKEVHRISSYFIIIILSVISDGFVIISCHEPITNRPQGQIIMDYLTDTILSVKVPLTGIPQISPDSRNVATIDHIKDGVKIVVQRINSKYYNLRILYKIIILFCKKSCIL